MKKRLKRKSSLALPQAEPNMTESDMVVLIHQIQQQLVFLEKKIDTLISQSLERPSEGKHFPKSSQHFNRSYRHDRGQQGSSFRERSFTRAICADCNKECEVPFKPSGDRPVYCKECFSKRKDGGPFKEKYDHKPKDVDSHQESYFDKRQGGESRRASEKKKPFFKRRGR